MKLTASNLLKHELVGLRTHVASSRDPGLVSKTGTIVDETREMLLLSTVDGTIMLPKSVCTFDMHLPNGDTVRIDGQLLRSTPENRLKKRQPRRW
ncbi:MAG: ribonuclease P protein component 1 [Promethearchaeota archaeon]